ncbi:hypoxanthine phosphoribosyltransferase [Marinilabilia salmonicolor]|uniref:hypoxanthine phosphoribosyltransferase n=1 Tax=Marinilabilia salmonicolor TaxID=989 RepID=UPI00029B1602|nr:hypoxanthine phosphoribosyltransferase [Marinilabilia salmonicolor]
MKRIQLLDKQFALSIPASDIKKALWEMAEKMNRELKDQNPLMICILNGSFMFSADLMKLIDFPCEISFVKLASYEGMGSTGKVKHLIGLNEEIEGRTIVLLEDIVDTGVTIENLMKQLDTQNPRDVKVATLLFKPEACKKDVKLDYVGLEIPNEFIVGYGLDYDGYGRNLPDIYTVIE